MKNILTSLFLLFLSYINLHADWTDKITVNGYFNVEFEDKVAGDYSGRFLDEHASFDSDMLDLVLNIQATDKVRIAIDFSWEHGSQSESGKGNVGYEYAFAEYTFSDAVKIRAGKMFTPFGIYNEIHTAKPSIIILKEPNPTNKMYFISKDKYEQTTFYPRWATGVAVLGNTELGEIPIDYVIQVANGDLSYGVDGNEFDKDDNDRKAITARVRAELTNELEVGASVHYDVMENYDSNDDSIGQMIINTQGLQMIWYPSDNFRLEAEFITGTLNAKGVTSFRRTGFSVVPSYYITQDINLYLLLGAADPNHGKDKDGATNTALGANFEVSNNIFIKADLFNVRSQENNTLYKGDSYTEFRAALSIGF